MLFFVLAACGPSARGSLADKNLSVAVQKPVVTSLRLDPHEVTLAPGEQLQLRILVSWSDGATIVPALQWTVEGGEVTPRGLYSAASTPGTYRVVVRLDAGTLADTAVVTVAAGAQPPSPRLSPPPTTPPPPPPPTGSWHEPSGYIAIVGRHFNSLGKTCGPYGCGRGTGSLPWMTGGSEGWDDIERTRPRITLAQDANAPLSPPSIVRFLYPPRKVPPTNTDSPGVAQMLGIHQPQAYYGTVRNYRKLYFRTAFRVSASFTGNPSGTNKMFFVRSVPGYEPIIRLRGVGSGPLVLNVDLQGSEGAGGDSRAARGGLNPNTSSARLATIQRGRWYVLEGVLEIGRDDQRNGVLRLWLDGVLTHSYTDVEYRKAGTAAAPDNWGYIHIAPTWGGGGGTIPQLMWLDFDDFYVSGAP